MSSMTLIRDLLLIIFCNIKLESDTKMSLLLVCFNSMNPANFTCSTPVHLFTDKTCSKLIMNISKNNDVIDVVLVFLLLIMNIFHTLF